MKTTIRSLGAILAMAFLTNLSPAQGKPLKVYVFAGQSNMTGMARTRTLEHIKMFPDTAEAFADLFDKDGKPVVLDDVCVSQWRGMSIFSGRARFGWGTGKESASQGNSHSMI